MIVYGKIQHYLQNNCDGLICRNPLQCFSTLSPDPTTMRSALFPATPRPLQGINHGLITSMAFQYVRWLPSSTSFQPLALDIQQHHHIRNLRTCLCSLVSFGCDLFHPFQLEKNNINRSGATPPDPNPFT